MKRFGKIFIILFLVLSVIYVLALSYSKVKMMRDKKEFDELSEGVHEYIIGGYHFMIPGEYLDHHIRKKPGEVKAIFLDAEMPDLHPWIPGPDWKVNLTNPDRINILIQLRHGRERPLDDFTILDNYENKKRQTLSNGWIYYDIDEGTSLHQSYYFKGMGTPMASRMLCNLRPSIPNPGCSANFNINEKIKVDFDFRLSRWENWTEIEALVRLKVNEFKINGVIRSMGSEHKINGVRVN